MTGSSLLRTVCTYSIIAAVAGRSFSSANGRLPDGTIYDESVR
jgi:hypothetical protein